MQSWQEAKIGRGEGEGVGDSASKAGRFAGASFGSCGMVRGEMGRESRWGGWGGARRLRAGRTFRREDRFARARADGSGEADDERLRGVVALDRVERAEGVCVVMEWSKLRSCGGVALSAAFLTARAGCGES